MRLTCLACATGYEIPEGGDPRLLACPACAAPQAANFVYERAVRFTSAEHPRYADACRAAREGRFDDALAALAEALRAGMDLDLAVGDPALARLRADPRWPDFVRKAAAS
jgi:hypothetical protein